MNSLQAIAGLDTNRGLTLCNRNLKLYVSLLGKFVKAQKHTLDNIRQAMADGDPDTAQRLAHTLKSLCATLGAEPAHLTVLGIEQAVREGQDAAFIESLLEPATVQLETLFASLRTTLGLNQDSAVS